MGRRALVLAVAAVLALVAASGVALADNIHGNGGDNRLVGTDGRDTISGGSGYDDIYGKDRQDRLFGDTGKDDVYGGDRGDRLQGGLGADDLFGQAGNDFVNAIDGQTNDRVDCGEGENDIAGIDDFTIFDPSGEADEVAPNCENLYLAIPGGVGVRGGAPATDLSSVDTVEEAERAEADGLLRQIR
jgi:Ca2+-binding RTX toxin-like protein